MTENKIPENIILTWKDNSIPNYIFERIKLLNPEKKIIFFTDEDIINFLLKNYNLDYVNFFNRLDFGRYKADFFRYCYLYKKGGYYVDIDIEFICPINDILEKDIDFFSVIGDKNKGHIFQALLFVKPNNIIIKNCITSMFYHGPKIGLDRHKFPIKSMYDNIYKFTNEIPKMGIIYKNNLKIQLAEELKINDRYTILYKSRKIGFSRYLNYDRYYGFNKTLNQKLIEIIGIFLIFGIICFIIIF